MLDFITIRENTEFVLNEKKSKFIANLIILKQKQEKFYDKRPNYTNIFRNR